MDVYRLKDLGFLIGNLLGKEIDGRGRDVD